MKAIAMILGLSLLSQSAFALSVRCNDERLSKHYETEEEAQVWCPKADNVLVQYDWGYRTWVCGCYNQ